MILALLDSLDDITIPIALEHTGIAMCVVFTVLIVISGLIYLLKFVPELLGGNEKKALEKAADALKNADVNRSSQLNRQPMQPKQMSGVKTASTGSVPKANDAQLVAVIAAAVAAYMSEETGTVVAADGLVIRSIKKRNN